jgi:hypothetical protein
MATIPVGDFGQRIARPGPLVNIPQANPIAAATDHLLNTAGQIGADMNAQQTRLDEARMRAQSALTLAKTNNELHAAHDDVARGVLDGSIPTDKAAGDFQQRVQKIQDTNLTGFMPDQRTEMDAHLANTTGTLGRSLGTVIEKRNQSETASTIDQFGEQVSREAARSGPAWAAQKYAAMVDFTGGAAGLNDAQRAKLKQGFSEKVHAQFYETAGVGALTKEDPAALGDLITKLQGPEGDPLDPGKRAQLTHQLFGWQQSLLAKQARNANAADDEARRRYNEAVDVFNKASDISLGGGYLSPEFITELTTKASGTEMEKPVLNLIGSQQKVAGFASRPAAERAEILNGLRNERATPGVGTDPLSDKLLTAATTMDEKLRAAAKDNPWEAAQHAGVIKDAGQIDPANPAQALQVVQQRMATLPLIERWTGDRASPLQPKEAETVSKMVRAMPFDQAASFLGNLGQAVGEQERIAAVGKQLHDKDGTLGLAMLYANSQTTQGRYTAELVLRGEQALKDKQVLDDSTKSTGWKAQIAAQINGAYSNREVENATKQAAYLIMAARSSDTTQGGVDIENAVKLATGGIVERNGGKVPLPYGMTEGDFDKRVKAITPESLASQAPGGTVRAGSATLPLAEFVKGLPDAQLVHAGQGLYSVRAGSGFVLNSAGQRIVLKVNP